MDDYFNKSILFDLYGGILNQKEQEVFKFHIIEDLSFNEIGEELSITRQGAYDIYKKADKKLKDIDDKIQLSKRFKNIESFAKEIIKLSEGNQKIINLSNKIIKSTLKGGND